MNNFPQINRSEKTISCFNCYQDLFDFDAIETKNPTGRGKFYACCETCGMKTYFDFTEAKNEHLQKNA